MVGEGDSAGIATTSSGQLSISRRGLGEQVAFDWKSISQLINALLAPDRICES
jgi:hypothetical protein